MGRVAMRPMAPGQDAERRTEMYQVRVIPSYRWDKARVGGIVFDKRQATPIHDTQITEEIRKSPLLVVEGGAEMVASQAAQEMARAEGLDLAELEGTGKGGLVVLRDVQRALKAREVESSQAAQEVADGL